MYKYVLISCATLMVIDMEAYFEKLPKHAPLHVPPQKRIVYLFNKRAGPSLVQYSLTKRSY